jgi:hypothetical protein
MDWYWYLLLAGAVLAGFGGTLLTVRSGIKRYDREKRK